MIEHNLPPDTLTPKELLAEHSRSTISLLLAPLLLSCLLLGTPSNLIALKHFLTSRRETVSEQMYACMSVLGAMVCIAQAPLLVHVLMGCAHANIRLELALEDWQEILQRSLVFCGLVLSGSKSLKILLPKWRFTGDHSGVLLILYCVKLFGELESRKRTAGNLVRNPMTIELCDGRRFTGALHGWGKFLYCLDALVIPMLISLSLITIFSNRHSRLITRCSRAIVILTTTLLISSLPNMVFSLLITISDVSTGINSSYYIQVFNRVGLVTTVTFNSFLFLRKKNSLKKFGQRTEIGSRSFEG
jgi:hypothetical protein